MKSLFNHIFYCAYCWNIHIIKEKDFPVLSAYLFVSVLIGINIISIYTIFAVYLIKNPTIYPDWGYWIIILLSFIPNYFTLIHKNKYKTILDHSQNLNKSEKRKKDIVMTLYIILTFLIGIYVIYASRDFLFQQCVLLE